MLCCMKGLAGKTTTYVLMPFSEWSHLMEKACHWHRNVRKRHVTRWKNAVHLGYFTTKPNLVEHTSKQEIWRLSGCKSCWHGKMAIYRWRRKGVWEQSPGALQWRDNGSWILRFQGNFIACQDTLKVCPDRPDLSQARPVPRMPSSESAGQWFTWSAAEDHRPGWQL